MKWYEKLFCKHEDKVEQCRFYTIITPFGWANYSVRAYKQLKCKKCGKVINDRVYCKDTHTYSYADDLAKSLKSYGYEDYNKLRLK
jgi:hypothetical protein